MAILISLGLSYHNSTAIFQGVIGKRTPFVRTPKFKAGNEGQITPTSYDLEKSSFKELPEILLFLYFAFAIAAGVYFQDIQFLPYHLIMLAGFGVILYYGYLERVQTPGRLNKNSDRSKPIAVAFSTAKN